jgi:hypothetical protein
MFFTKSDIARVKQTKSNFLFIPQSCTIKLDSNLKFDEKHNKEGGKPENHLKLLTRFKAKHAIVEPRNKQFHYRNPFFSFDGNGKSPSSFLFLGKNC